MLEWMRPTLSGAKGSANFAGASLVKARLDGADFLASRRNVRAMVKLGFESAKLDGASLKGARLGRCYMEFASLKGADLTGADLTGADLAGANLSGADIKGAEFAGVDLDSAHVGGILNAGEAKNFDKVINLDRAFKD